MSTSWFNHLGVWFSDIRKGVAQCPQTRTERTKWYFNSRESPQNGLSSWWHYFTANSTRVGGCGPVIRLIFDHLYPQVGCRWNRYHVRDSKFVRTMDVSATAMDMWIVLCVGGPWEIWRPWKWAIRINKKSFLLWTSKTCKSDFCKATTTIDVIVYFYASLIFVKKGLLSSSELFGVPK
jgi:hypothetical protein